MQETWVRSLGQDHPLEKRMGTYSNILAWQIPWTEEPDGVQPGGHKESDTTEQLTLSLCSLFSVYMSILIAPLPPDNCARLFSMSVTLFLFCR